MIPRPGLEETNESCERRLTSRIEEAGQAEKEIKAAFDAHKCESPKKPTKPSTQH